MTPDELRMANVRRYEDLQGREIAPDLRRRVEQLLYEERNRPDSGYPPEPPYRRRPA